VDTRTKILSPAEAESLRARAARLKVVTGYFDPLLAAHARRLAELKQPGETLLVVVTEPEHPLLAAAARAELAAALAVVDCVMLAGADLPRLLETLRPDELIREEAADERRKQELADLVRRRQAL
jgi:bifunctional ADP-heptose synthase (sugar kinase/adenylyltransferase)